jgi:hypothetical protein
MLGPTNNVCVRISTTGDGGMLELYRHIGRRSLWMQANDNGGFIRVFGYKGKDGLTFSGSKKEGEIVISNRAGEQRAEIFVNDFDFGDVELMSPGE